MIPEHRLKDMLRNLRRSLERHTRHPRVGGVQLGSLDRATPISRNWGFDRGQPVDRRYIERFLDANRRRIAGRVLEVADNAYTRRFGSAAVTRSDILHDQEGHGRATVVADLSDEASVPRGVYDCIICTQTLQLIYDKHAALRSLHTMLSPGGTLLLTVPGISAISREDMDRHGDFWRFTSAAVARLLGSVFGGAAIDVVAFGNVYAATAFLHGLAVEELDARKLDFVDPDCELLITASATKQALQR